MHSPIVETLFQIIHVITSVFLVLVVLLQQGKGGGLGAAFGGAATAQVFGGRGAGNLLTRATAVSAAIFMITSVSLAYISSSADRALKQRADEINKKAEVKAATPVKDKEPAPAENKPTEGPSDKPAEGKPADTGSGMSTPEAPAPK